MNQTKNQKRAFLSVSLSCAGAIGVCLIVNFAVSGMLTWAIFPLLSILYAWAIAVPALLFQKRRIETAFAVSTVLLLPYLFILDMNTPGRDWFIPLAIPISLIGIAALWLGYFSLMKMKNSLHISALFVFMLGVLASPAIVLIAQNFADVEREFLSFYLTPFICLLVSAALFIAGLVKRSKVGKVSNDYKVG